MKTKYLKRLAQHSIRQTMKSHHCRRVSLPLTFPSDFILNGLTDGQFTGSLTDLSQISTGKAIGHLGQVVHVHVLHKKEYINTQ